MNTIDIPLICLTAITITLLIKTKPNKTSIKFGANGRLEEFSSNEGKKSYDKFAEAIKVTTEKNRLPLTNFPMTPMASKIISEANKVAQSWGHAYIDPHHLCIALLETDHERVSTFLKGQMKMDPKQAAKEVRDNVLKSMQAAPV